MGERSKTILYLVLFIVIFIVITVFLNTRNNGNQNNVIKADINKSNGKIVEVNDKSFEKEVLNSDKKVLVDFYATWCGPCKSLEPIIKDVSSEYGNIKVVRVDVDKCKELVYKYGIQAMPTLVVIENGKEINRSVGAIPKNKILELLGI